jgi:DNA replication protein DnaC
LSQVYEILVPDFRQPGAERGGTTLSTLNLHGEQTFETFSLRTGDELSVEERNSLRSALGMAQAFAEAPSGWLVLFGVPGCGKTHLAAAIANRQVALGRPVPIFVVVPDLLDHLRETFSPGSSTSLDKLFEQVKSASLLVLDDLGTESATPWAREKLFQLFNHRYVARLPTVITSSRKIEAIEPPIQSRMRDAGRCMIALINVPSYRGSGTQRAEVRKESKRPATKRLIED